MIIQKSEGMDDFFTVRMGSRPAVVRCERHSAILSWREAKEDTDATLLLHDIAWTIVGMAGCGEVSTIGYPESITIRFPVAARKAMQKAMDRALEGLRDLMLHCKTPLYALLHTLLATGFTRGQIAKAAGISLGRLSVLLKDPYAGANSETMARLRILAESGCDPFLSAMHSAADAYCRNKLGEMYSRMKGGKK